MQQLPSLPAERNHDDLISRGKKAHITAAIPPWYSLFSARIATGKFIWFYSVVKSNPTVLPVAAD